LQYCNIDFNNKTILITGGAGFIGSNIAFYFQENYPKAKIIVFDKFRSTETLSNGNLKSFGHYKNLLGFKGVVISGDINNRDDLKDLEVSYTFDYIFHQAAISDTTVNEQDLMIQTNVNAYEDILKIAIKHSANIVYASSAATYGDSQIFEVGHEDPNNVYGFSKLMMDNITQKYINQNEKISIVGLRYFNVYGNREFFKNKTASTVIQFAHQILQGKAPKLFEDSDKILRDFIYIEDVIQANIKACSSNISGIYNVGTGLARSFQDISDIVQKELSTAYETQYINNPFIGQYQFFTQADISKTKQDLNYKVNYTLEEGIHSYMDNIKIIYDKEVNNEK
jgi:ADP-L-glycero-D-manno-heptose 6-epimerase